MPSLIRKTFSVPPLGCNCSIIGDPVTKQAVVIDPGETNVDDEQQVAFQLLRRLSERQARIQDLSGRMNKLNADEQEELPRIQQELQRDESFLEYLIELERQLGISSYFF